MKKILTLFMILLISANVYAASDKYSKEYLQNNTHFSLFRPLAEGIVERNIKKSLKKETGANFDVKFSGYSVSSMKKGIFKSLELSGKNITSNDIPIPYVHLKSLTDYNYIEYNKNPMVFKSDMQFAYDIELSEESMNTALEKGNYGNTIKSVNKVAYPLFVIKKVKTKIIQNKLYIVMDYNFPVIKSSKDKSFVMSSDVEVVNGKIKAKNVSIDKSYGNIGINKVANLINLLNPLEFTLSLLDEKQCQGNIENVKIVDNIIKVDGKINIKGEE